MRALKVAAVAAAAVLFLVAAALFFSRHVEKHLERPAAAGDRD